MSKVMIDETKTPLRNCLNIAMPAVVESVLISFLGMVDIWMVSGLGSGAVAAVGLTNQPRLMIMTIFFALSVSCSAIVARRSGEGDRKSANVTMVTALIISVIVFVLVALITCIFAGQIMTLCGTQPDTHSDATSYFRIIMAGLIFTVVSLIINACQRGIGNTKIALVTNVVANLVNIFFNYLLIEGHFGFPALGVTGAAIATVLGSVAGCIVSVAVIFRKDGFISIPYILKEKIRLTKDGIKKLYPMASTLFLENVAQRVGLLVTAIITASLGTGPFAAHQVGMTYLNLAFAFGDGLQASSVALVGYSFGKNSIDSAKRYINLCIKIGLVIGIIISAVCFFFGKQLFMLYFTEPDLVEMGVIISRYFSAIVIIQLIQIICSGSLRGAGDVRFMMFSTILCVTVLQPFATWLFAIKFNMGISGIWLQILVIQAVRLVLVAGRIISGKWTTKAV